MLSLVIFLDNEEDMKAEWRELTILTNMKSTYAFDIRGKYLVSNTGKIYGCKNKKMKSIRKDCKGYCYTVLSIKGKQYSQYIHRLVARCFLPLPESEEQQEVDHINRIKDDNRAENLRWASRQEQMTNVSKSTRQENRAKETEPEHLEFRQLEDFSKYKIYSNGSIWSIDSSKFLKTQPDTRGYQYITLRNDSKEKHNMVVHRMVALAFLRSPENEDYVVNHKDGNPSNNDVSNLEWCSQSSNSIHAMDTGLSSRRIQVSQYDKQGNLIRTFKSLSEAESETGVKRQSLTRVCQGTQVTAGGFRWAFNND